MEKNRWYPANIICREPHVRLLVRGSVTGMIRLGRKRVNRQNIACLFLLLSVILLMIIPVSASLDRDTIPVSKDPLAENNPEIIAALKMHIAYVGQSQQARMDGVISYIDRISGGNGTSSLRDIEDDYMETASSVPVMHTADEIAEARGELRTQTQLFSEETKAQMVMFNGSTDEMRNAINASVQPMENSSFTLRDSLWLARDTARITVFNKESQERSAILGTIGKQGINTSLAQNISQQIDIQRSSIQKALADNSARALKEANNGLKSLNHQFRGVVQTYRDDLQLQAKQATVLAMNQE